MPVRDRRYRFAFYHGMPVEDRPYPQAKARGLMPKYLTPSHISGFIFSRKHVQEYCQGAMNEKIQYWMDLAEYDLETAGTMLEGKRFLYVGFMCHQAIEKILKGYYVFARQENPPYTHNLTLLTEISGLCEVMSGEQKDFLNSLEPMNVEARYPTYKVKLLQALDFKRCKGMLRETQELYEWIKDKLLKK
jgi:HEPN domain-containing protein